jgi:hypothetical protein
VEKGSPTDMETLLRRFGEVGKGIAQLKAGLARKEEIIAGLQQRLYGSGGEWSGST